MNELEKMTKNPPTPLDTHTKTSYVQAELEELLPEAVEKFKTVVRSSENKDFPKVFDQLCDYVGVTKQSDKVNFQAGAQMGSRVAMDAIGNMFQAMVSGMGIKTGEMDFKTEKVVDEQTINNTEGDTLLEDEESEGTEQEINNFQFE